MPTYTCENCVFGLKMRAEDKFLCMYSFQRGECVDTLNLMDDCCGFLNKFDFPKAKLAQQIYNDFLNDFTL